MPFFAPLWGVLPFKSRRSFQLPHLVQIAPTAIPAQQNLDDTFDDPEVFPVGVFEVDCAVGDSEFGQNADVCSAVFGWRNYRTEQKWAKTPILVQVCSVRTHCKMNKDRSFRDLCKKPVPDRKIRNRLLIMKNSLSVRTRILHRVGIDADRMTRSGG